MGSRIIISLVFCLIVIPFISATTLNIVYDETERGVTIDNSNNTVYQNISYYNITNTGGITGGNCSAGYVVQNISPLGVPQCVQDQTGAGQNLQNVAFTNRSEDWTTNNVSANYFKGNGSLLTDIPIFNSTYNNNADSIASILASTGIYNSTFNLTYENYLATINSILASTSVYNSTFNQTYATNITEINLAVESIRASTAVYNASTAGNPFNQNLNTTDNPTFNNITVTDWIKGKFNWVLTLTSWITGSFNGTTLSLDLNETKLNDTIDLRLNTTFYNASTVSIIRGGTPEGNLGDIQAYDNKVYNVTEVSGANGIDVRINFTDVISVNQLIFRYKSDADETHQMVVQLYDYVASNWQSYATLSEVSDYNIKEIGIFDSAEHVSGGIVQVRFYQSSSGITTHKHYWDWVTVAKGPATPAGTEIDPFSYHKNQNITATGYNITADYFFGDGSKLTNLATGAFNSTYETNITELNGAVASIRASTSVYNSTFNQTYNNYNATLLSILASTGVYNATFNSSYGTTGTCGTNEVVQNITNTGVMQCIAQTVSTASFNQTYADYNLSIDGLLRSTGVFNSTFNITYNGYQGILDSILASTGNYNTTYNQTYDNNISLLRTDVESIRASTGVYNSSTAGNPFDQWLNKSDSVVFAGMNLTGLSPNTAGFILGIESNKVGLANTNNINVNRSNFWDNLDSPLASWTDNFNITYDTNITDLNNAVASIRASTGVYNGSGSSFNQTYDTNITQLNSQVGSILASTGVYNSTFNTTYDNNISLLRTDVESIRASTGVYNGSGGSFNQTYADYNLSIDGLLRSTGVFNSTFNISYNGYQLILDSILASTSVYNATFNSSYATTGTCGTNQVVQNLTNTGTMQCIALPSASAGNPFDQWLNTTNDAKFNNTNFTGRSEWWDEDFEATKAYASIRMLTTEAGDKFPFIGLMFNKSELGTLNSYAVTGDNADTYLNAPSNALNFVIGGISGGNVGNWYKSIFNINTNMTVAGELNVTKNITASEDIKISGGKKICLSEDCTSYMKHDPILNITEIV